MSKVADNACDVCLDGIVLGEGNAIIYWPSASPTDLRYMEKTQRPLDILDIATTAVLSGGKPLPRKCTAVKNNLIDQTSSIYALSMILTLVVDSSSLIFG